MSVQVLDADNRKKNAIKGVKFKLTPHHKKCLHFRSIIFYPVIFLHATNLPKIIVNTGDSIWFAKIQSKSECFFTNEDKTQTKKKKLQCFVICQLY